MKKKILALSVCVVMLAVAIVGGTLAYFTDTDAEVNTFTVGGVKIDLIEQQSSEDGKTFVPYVNEGKVLMPIVGSAQSDKKDNGQPAAENYIDKIVTIKNTGKSDAWVRAYFAIPSALDDGFVEGFNASLNVLHFNFGNANGASTYNNQWLWGSEAKPQHSGWNYFETKINGVDYSVYYADYYKKLAADATTEQFVSGVYLDSHVDMKNGKYVDTRDLTADLSILEGKVSCPVFAVAVQADGQLVVVITVHVGDPVAVLAADFEHDQPGVGLEAVFNGRILLFERYLLFNPDADPCR